MLLTFCYEGWEVIPKMSSRISKVFAIKIKSRFWKTRETETEREKRERDRGDGGSTTC